MADQTTEEGCASPPKRYKTPSLERPVEEKVSQKAVSDFLQVLRGTQNPRDNIGAMGASTENHESQSAIPDETTAAKKRRKRKPRKRRKKAALQSSAAGTVPQECKAEADKDTRPLQGRNDSKSSPSPTSNEKFDRICPAELVDILKNLSDQERRELRSYVYTKLTGADKDKARQALVAEYRAKRQGNKGRVSKRPTGTRSTRNNHPIDWNAVRVQVEIEEETAEVRQNRDNESLEMQRTRARVDQAFHQWLVAMSDTTDAVNEYRESESRVHGLLKKLSDTRVQAVKSLKWLMVNGGRRWRRKEDEKVKEPVVYNPVDEVTNLVKRMRSYLERAKFIRTDKYERFRAWMRKTHGFDPENIPDGFSEGDPGDDLEGDTEIEEG